MHTLIDVAEYAQDSFSLSLITVVLAVLLTPMYTYLAYKYKFWKKQRQTSTTGEKLKVFTKLHADKFKRNIPTMAGVIIVLSVFVVTFFLNLDRGQTFLPLASLVGGAIVGLIDDVINVFGSGRGVAGLRSGLKFLMILILGLVLGWFFYAKLGYHSIHIPFDGDLDLGWLIIPVFAFAVLATGNAVNISDGLDGLAGGLAVAAFAGFGMIAIFQGHAGMASFCFTMIGALVAYLWFNIYPARFFMGDVGSFAIGTSLGVIAMLTDSFLLLPVIGLLFVIEAGSSLLQISCKRMFGKRIFISAPIHQHLQAKGWEETKITMRFWLIAAMMAFIGVLIALKGGHI
ncbi:MAG: phospho-N-acetylmuramoyl-pentapeptide-transferase [Candidatus Saccharibacteria bacterium]|nr:phospho-N-acetylmuramoyl-pentapeptide-transferase [Candidatus Saccharibacteria bacterium]